MKGYTVESFEKKFATKDYPAEWIGMFDKSGKPLFIGSSGFDGAVYANDFVVDGVNVYKEALKKAVTVSHTHPAGGTFSIADFVTFARNDISVMRVVGGDTVFLMENVGKRFTKGEIESIFRSYYDLRFQAVKRKKNLHQVFDGFWMLHSNKGYIKYVKKARDS